MMDDEGTRGRKAVMRSSYGSESEMIWISEASLSRHGIMAEKLPLDTASALHARAIRTLKPQAHRLLVKSNQSQQAGSHYFFAA